MIPQARPCSTCTNIISVKRLAAMPNTRLCITCKEASQEAILTAPPSNMRRLGYVGKTYSDDSGAMNFTKVKAVTYGLGTGV